jgi:hypothetical protein
MRDQLRALADHYLAYLEVFDTIDLAAPHADYRWGHLPSELSGTWLAYREMFDEFSREIANTINQLINKEQRLGGWEKVVVNLDEDAFNNVLFEFIEPIATLALNLPVVIRERVIFASAHLMHQANRALDHAVWNDDLPADHSIKANDLESYGSNWGATPKLISELKLLAAQGDYKAATGNFRNKYNHRFPAHVGLGFTGGATRHVNPTNKRASYEIGDGEPLSLKDIRQFLHVQIGYAHNVYNAFKTLIREQETMIIRWESEHGIVIEKAEG